MANYRMRLLKRVNGRGNAGFEFVVTNEEQRDNYVAKGMAKVVETIPDPAEKAVATSPVDRMVHASASVKAPLRTQPVARRKTRGRSRRG